MIPYQKHSETSKEAAFSVTGRASSLRELVHAFIAWANGATDEEIQRALNMSGSTERPRRRELQVAGRVIDSGLVRTTASGRRAVVWVTA
jgi:hypothetical protein